MSVSGLYIHPVKSLRAVSVTKSALDDKGLAGDRRLMIVYPLPLPPWKEQWDIEKDTTHRFLTQRQCPSLARVKAIYSGEDAQALLLSYGDKILEVALAQKSSNAEKRFSYRAGIWDDQVLVEDMGEIFLRFLFSGFLDSRRTGTFFTHVASIYDINLNDSVKRLNNI